MFFLKKCWCVLQDGQELFFVVLCYLKLFVQFDIKIVCVCVQDEFVFYVYVLFGFDVFLCSVCGVQLFYLVIVELCKCCIELIVNVFEQLFDGFENGGYWYEVNGFGFFVFVSCVCVCILFEFGVGMKVSLCGGFGCQNVGDMIFCLFG